MFLNEIRNLQRDVILAATVTAFPETENPAAGFFRDRVLSLRVRERFQTRSSATAMPWPTPMHMVESE